MYVTAIAARGFRDLPDTRLEDLGRIVDLKGPTPATTALGDALELAFAALSDQALEALLLRWGLLGPGEQPELTGEVFPEEVAWDDQHAARALVADERQRSLEVEVTLALDPPLYGLLRGEAARDPRVVSALGQGGTITLAVGALFTSTFDTLALSIQSFRIGAESFPARASDRPRWLTRLLRELADRFHRYDPEADTAAVALQAMTSRAGFEGWEAWRRALQPDGPTLRAARGPGGLPVLLGDDLPLRRFGHQAERDAGLAAAVHLSRADVVWAESGRAWLAGTVTGDASALEQVFRVHPSGTRELEAPADDVPAPTRTLPTALHDTSQ
jgi:hypothetical protein